MTRQVLYVAAPLRPTEEEVDAIEPFTISPGCGEYEVDAKIWKPHETRVREALRANLDRAMAWLRWLRRSFPETTFIAPWIASVLSGDDDADPSQREAGIADACAVIERCDGIVLVGPRISEGMRREMEHGVQHALAEYDGGPCPFAVYDMTGDRAYMPSDVELRTDESWAEWARALRV